MCASCILCESCTCVCWIFVFYNVLYTVYVYVQAHILFHSLYWWFCSLPFNEAVRRAFRMLRSSHDVIQGPHVFLPKTKRQWRSTIIDLAPVMLNMFLLKNFAHQNNESKNCTKQMPSAVETPKPIHHRLPPPPLPQQFESTCFSFLSCLLSPTLSLFCCPNNDLLVARCIMWHPQKCAFPSCALKVLERVLMALISRLRTFSSSLKRVQVESTWCGIHKTVEKELSEKERSEK